MSTPLIWIIFPGLLAVGLLLIQRWERLVVILGTLASAALAATAYWLPVQDRFFIGPVTLRLSSTWTILGRRFMLSGADRPALIMLYLAAALWFGAAQVARPGRSFVPLGLGMVALLTAAIAVEPFLYSALLVEIAVLVLIPLLTRPGESAGRGVLRFLTFQTLGMPFILFTGWLLTGVETAPGEPLLAQRAALLLGLGFAFMLGVVPFHTWLPMLTEEAHIFAAAFVLLLLPGALLFLGLRFFDRYAWLRTLEGVTPTLRIVGIVMVVAAGVLAAFQRHLGRMLAFAVIQETGLSLLALGLGTGAGLGVFGAADAPVRIFFAGLLPRGLALGVWALGLTVLQRRAGGLHFRHVQGMARRFPLAGLGSVLAHFSLAGLPLLPGFTVRLALLEGLAAVSLVEALWVLFGIGGLLFGGLRTLAVVVMGPEEADWQSGETWAQRLYLVAGLVGLLLVGLLPHLFLPLFANLPQAFQLVVP